MTPPDDDELDDDALDDDLADLVAPAPTGPTPMQKLAAELIGRLERAEAIEISPKRAKALLDGLADQLGSLTPAKPAGPTLAAWLSDHPAVEELYASDDELETALRDSVAALQGT